MSIFVPSNDSKDPYTKDQSDRRFQRRDPDIVSVPLGAIDEVILSDGVNWVSGTLPSSLPVGNSQGNFLYWDVKTASFQVGGANVSLGANSGLNQGNNAVNIGGFNTPGSQDFGAIALGTGCCLNNGLGTQGIGSVSIGRSACGEGNQQTESIAIGNNSASFGQGVRCIAIGSSAGFAGSGTPQPGGQIHLNATNLITAKTQPNALYIEPIRISSVGNPLLYNSSGEIVVNTSSERYKTNIVDITPEESQKIYDLNPVKFDRINGEVCGEFGLIAEQVNEVDKSLVVLDKDNQPDGIHWFRVVPLLLAELRRLKDRIDVLESNQLPQDSPVLERSPTGSGGELGGFAPST